MPARTPTGLKYVSKQSLRDILEIYKVAGTTMFVVPYLKSKNISFHDQSIQALSESHCVSKEGSLHRDKGTIWKLTGVATRYAQKQIGPANIEVEKESLEYMIAHLQHLRDLNRMRAKPKPEA